MASLPGTTLTLTGPMWLPLFWAVQLVVAFVGVCYYVVVERTLGMVSARANRVNRTRVRIRWYLAPVLVAALPVALLVQLIVASWHFLVWWHKLVGQWQFGSNKQWTTIVAAIVFELVAILVFVGSYHQVLPWGIYGRVESIVTHDTPPWLEKPGYPERWYRYDGSQPLRVLLVGPLSFGVILLLVLPGVISQIGSEGWQRFLFWVRNGLAVFALYSALLPVEPVDGQNVNLLWLQIANVIAGVLVIVALMVLARKTSRGRSTWRQFVWFAAVRLLEKKRIALFSLAAVCLCTAMLVIVVSIMGGFVQQVREKTHGLMADIVLEGEMARGFPYYQGFIDLMKRKPYSDIIETATPVLQTAGALKVAQPSNPQASWTRAIRVNGIVLDGKIAVSDFGKGLHYYKRDRASVVIDREIQSPYLDEDVKVYGMIYGLDLPYFAYRDPDGEYHRNIPQNWPCTLSVVPMSLRGGLLDRMSPAVTRKFCMVDDSRTGVYDIDSNTVYIDFHVLQDLLAMNRLESDDGKVLPARTHQIHIKLREGVKLDRENVAMVNAWWLQYRLQFDDPLLDLVQVGTWHDYNRTLISAVENEKRLMITLFALISIVAVFLILCIFYMIVAEKIRDIGILKSIGASAIQVAAIFLAYAGVIGVVGATLGAALGWVFVQNINSVQDWLIRVFGWRVWDRQVYAFDEIPHLVEWDDVVMIVVAAVVASVVGAIIPAIRAAKMNPVEALRYE